MKRKLLTGICAISAVVISLCSCSLPWEHYENAPEKWRHTWFIYSSGLACEEAMDGLIAAAEAGDREALKKMFAPNVYNQPGFDKELDDFLAAYPGGFLSENADLSDMYDHGGVESGSVDEGSRNYRYGRGGHVTLNGEYYIMDVDLCYINDAVKDAVGVTSFHIYTMNSVARYKENDNYYYGYPHYPEFDKERALGCYMNRDREAAYINGGFFAFDNMPEVLPTEQEIIDAVNKVNKKDGKIPVGDLTGLFGDFHGEEKRDSYAADSDKAYILAPVDGIRRFARITIRNGMITYIYTCPESSLDYNNRNIIYRAGDYKDTDDSDKSQNKTENINNS